MNGTILALIALVAGGLAAFLVHVTGGGVSSRGTRMTLWPF